MSEIFWEGAGPERIYIDGKKLYFVRNPEGMAILVFIMLFATPFFVQGYEWAITRLAAQAGLVLPEELKIAAGFATSLIILSLGYIFLFYRPSKIPGDQRKKYLCYDLKRKVLEEKKADGSMGFVALGTHVHAEFPFTEQQVLHSARRNTYYAYLTFNNVRHVIAGDVSSINLKTLMKRMSDLGMKAEVS